MVVDHIAAGPNNEPDIVAAVKRFFPQPGRNTVEEPAPARRNKDRPVGGKRPIVSQAGRQPPHAIQVVVHPGQCLGRAVRRQETFKALDPDETKTIAGVNCGGHSYRLVLATGAGPAARHPELDENPDGARAGSSQVALE